jgi:hypothetical protein
MFLAGFRTGIRVSQMGCHGKGVHGAGFRGSIAGPDASWSPPLHSKPTGRHMRGTVHSILESSTMTWPAALLALQHLASAGLPAGSPSLGVFQKPPCNSRPATFYSISVCR